MARDGKVPAPRFLSKVSEHKVPVNAIWVVIPITAVFTFWARVEVVIIALCTFAMYLTYGFVVAACLWGNRMAPSLVAGQRKRPVSRKLCAAALAWIVGILALLLYMTAISMSHQTLMISLIVAGLIAACVVGYLLARPRGPRTLRPERLEAPLNEDGALVNEDRSLV